MLHFDILEDLSDDIELCDYFHFLMINDLTYELNYRSIKRAMFYLKTFKYVGSKRSATLAMLYNDLDAIKFMHKMGFKFSPYALKKAYQIGLMDIVKWAVDVAGVIKDDLIDCAYYKNHYDDVDWLHKKGYRVCHNTTINRSWDSVRHSGSDVLKLFYNNDHDRVLQWLSTHGDRLAIAKWLHVHCGYDFYDIVIDKP